MPPLQTLCKTGDKDEKGDISLQKLCIVKRAKLTIWRYFNE